MFKIRQSKYRHVFCDQPKGDVRENFYYCWTTTTAGGLLLNSSFVFGWWMDRWIDGFIVWLDSPL